MLPTILSVTVTPEGVAVIWRFGDGPEQLMCAEHLLRAAQLIHEACAPSVKVSPSEWTEALKEQLGKTVGLAEALCEVLRRALAVYSGGGGGGGAGLGSG